MKELLTSPNLSAIPAYTEEPLTSSGPSTTLAFPTSAEWLLTSLSLSTELKFLAVLTAKAPADPLVLLGDDVPTEAADQRDGCEVPGAAAARGL